MPPTFHTPNSTLLTPYFGARYYQSTHSFWLSVDPLVDKYPNLSPYTYCAGNPVRYFDPDGRVIVDNPYLIFNGEHGCLQIWDDNNTPDDYNDDTFIGEYSAHNNVTQSSQGKWEDGIYDMLDQKNSNKHGDKKDDRGILLDSPNGSYGSAGCYRATPFTEKTTKKVRVGMAVHAGREHKTFLNRKKQGCVRTTPDAMEMMSNAISVYGPLKRIIIQNNRVSPDSENVAKIVPQTLYKLNPIQLELLPISMPKCLSDKTRVITPFIQ